jgi:hypothetical protein
MPAFDVTYVMGTTGEHETGGLEFRGRRAKATVRARNRVEAYVLLHRQFAAGVDVVIADRGPNGLPLGMARHQAAALRAAGVPVEGGRLPKLGVPGVRIERIEVRETP